jgi:hypothetical protein
VRMSSLRLPSPRPEPSNGCSVTKRDLNQEYHVPVGFSGRSGGSLSGPGGLRSGLPGGPGDPPSSDRPELICVAALVSPKP